MRVVVRKARFLLPAGAVSLVALLQLSTPAFATTVTIQGPLGTTVTTPPLQLGAPGQPGPVDGTSVSVAGVSASADGAAANPSPAPPAAPTGQGPTQQTPATESRPSTLGAVSQPGGVKDDGQATEPVRRGGAETRSPNDSATAPSRSRRSESGGSVSTSAKDGAATPAGERVADEPATRRPRRLSVAERIVDRVPAEYRLGLFAVAALACGFAVATAHERRRARRAESEALFDPLTGLANRRAFDRRLAEEWKRSERYERPLGLVMLDLDGFKQVNDTRGHKEGDRVLREAASLIADRLRTIDMAARLGGDEFAALCPETPSEGLDALAHSLERCLEGLPVGASMGFAEREPEDENPLDLLERADAAMYRQKHGREDAQPVTVV